MGLAVKTEGGAPSQQMQVASRSWENKEMDPVEPLA